MFYFVYFLNNQLLMKYVIPILFLKKKLKIRKNKGNKNG
jgi:hypothetical protein